MTMMNVSLNRVPTSVTLDAEGISKAVYGAEDHADIITNYNLVDYESLRPSTDPQNTDIVVPATPPPAFDMPTNDPQVDWQIRQLQQYAEEDLTVLVFSRTLVVMSEVPGVGGASPSIARQPFWKIDGLTSCKIRTSLFEGARALEMSWPPEYNSLPNINLYGNQVVVGVRGEPIFAGVMTGVKVSSKKGVLRTWTAQSHSFVALNTHFNPNQFKAGFNQMTPLDIIRFIARRYYIPVAMDSSSEQLLEVPYKDQDGLQEINSDIAGTTPFKLIQKLVSAVGLFVYAREDGALVIRKVNPASPAVSTLVDDDMAEFDVKYNYSELARTYCVMSQKRDSEDIEIAEFTNFPLPIFKNRVREEGLGQALDMANIWHSGAAVYEMSKSLAGAVNIGVTVPDWINADTGSTWALGTAVEMLAPNYGLERLNGEMIRGIVSSTVFSENKNVKKTELSISLPGVFDVTLDLFLPFLSEEGVPTEFRGYQKSEVTAEDPFGDN